MRQATQEIVQHHKADNQTCISRAHSRKADNPTCINKVQRHQVDSNKCITDELIIISNDYNIMNKVGEQVVKYYIWKTGGMWNDHIKLLV